VKTAAVLSPGESYLMQRMTPASASVVRGALLACVPAALKYWATPLSAAHHASHATASLLRGELETHPQDLWRPHGR
jgi:hypothetical protein